MSAPAPLASYEGLAGTYDEIFDSEGRPRPELASIVASLSHLSRDEIARRQTIAERMLLHQGVTFSVYADARGAEKIFPFCLFPRVVAADAWSEIDRGVRQRIRALGLFLDDVYGPKRICRELPLIGELVGGAKGRLPFCEGLRPPRGVRIHVAGVDLVRDPAGRFLVLEDNLRTPSGVSYVLENRRISKQLLGGTLADARIEGVDAYPARLADALRAASPVDPSETYAVVLTPGPYNSAYFEHSFLARTMGLELVEAGDLFVDGDYVYARTTRGRRRVDVIYRRTDETFLDPTVFRADSLLGVPGIMRVYAAGNVALANAPGNGVADDKALYPFVPEMIRFYLAEEPILGQVPSYVCARPDDCAFVLEHLPELVVKAVDEAGGYGMLMGPQASAAELAEFSARVAADPRKYIAQPRIELSSCPTWDGAAGGFSAKRVDLRPYALTTPEGTWVLPGGLTRVALAPGSYVVNSSQGGGSKDTWVMARDASRGAP